MVLVLLLDLRYTSSVFSTTSGRKCSLNARFSHAKRESNKLLPVDVEPPQGFSEVISGLSSVYSILYHSGISSMSHTLRPKSVSSALVLFSDTVKNSEERRDGRSRVPFTIVERSVLPFDDSLDLQGLHDTRSSDGGFKLPRDVTYLPLWWDILNHPGLDRRAFAYGSVVMRIRQ
jgi:hypothetical protein